MIKKLKKQKQKQKQNKTKNNSIYVNQRSAWDDSFLLFFCAPFFTLFLKVTEFLVAASV